MTSEDFVVDLLDRVYAVPRELRVLPLPYLPRLPELPPSGQFAAIEETGEEMVDASRFVRTFDIYAEAGFDVGPVHLVRRSVAEKLERVDAYLPSEFNLVIVEGFRTPELQQFLFERATAQHGEGARAYAADPSSTDGVVPPHSTGGAVDVTLEFGGRLLRLGTPVGQYTPDSALSSLEPTGRDPDRSLRRLLYLLMTKVGFVGISEEWWHYSYGDQEWAVQTGAARARYGTVVHQHG